MNPAIRLALALVLVASAAQAAKRKPCGDTSWVVADAPIVPGDTTLQHNGVVLRGGKLAIGGVCAPAKAKRKASKRGTRLAARWKSCTGVVGPVRFKGTTDTTCGALTGTVSAPKAKLTVAVHGDAVPTGAVTGQVRIVRAVAVPASIESDVLASKSQIEAGGLTVAPDGSAIAYTTIGAAGWLVRLGDRTTRTADDGTFTLTLDPAPATEVELFHPGQIDEAAVVFWAVPHLVAAGGTPVPLDVSVETQGACGMDDAPADNPAYCAAAGAPASLVVAQGHAHHHAHAHDGFTTAPLTSTWTAGSLGTYPPSTPSTTCADQDGGIGASGETTFGALTNYLFSTCHTQVFFGCCDNELGSLTVSVKTALGKLTGFKPISCNKNHKGRQCQDVLQGDVGVQVPAGKASAQAQIRTTFGFPGSIGQPVVPGQVVPVVVHHNACYGETAVKKTLDQLGGVLSGTVFGNDERKIEHFTKWATGNFTFQPDVSITYTAGNCPPNVATASDTYEFSADGDTVSVTFTATCAQVTTTTTQTAGPTTTTLAGRAVTLGYAAGPVAAGQNLCLSRVTGGCVAQAHLPYCSYVHLHAGNEFGIGIDGDGPYPDPEFGHMDPCGFGPVVTVPGCGPDSVPPC